MKTVYFKYKLKDGDGVGKGWTYNDINNQRTQDQVYGYSEIPYTQFTAFRPEYHYFDGVKISPKIKLDLIIDQTHIEKDIGKAIISWKADTPVHVLINNHYHADTHDTQVEFTSGVSRTHKFQILDSRYYSEPIQITVEDHGKD